VIAGGAIAIVAVLIVVVVLIVNATSSSSGSASATATPNTTTTGGSLPGAAEVAASTRDCAPFLSAGNGKVGPKQWSKPPTQVIDAKKHYQVKLYTTAGTITADILPKLAPITANNFIFLSCNGYYSGVIFHRVVPGFVIQGGDPTGTGSGGPGYQFKDEPVARNYTVGSLAMANSGANTNGSQFFVIQGPQGVQLPHSYNLFGQVTKGENVVDAIANAPTHAGSSGEKSSPDKPVVIKTVTVHIS
jgi:cyclophilin family peptidyl-prolyl cis-trans isomerase